MNIFKTRNFQFIPFLGKKPHISMLFSPRRSYDNFNIAQNIQTNFPKKAEKPIPPPNERIPDVTKFLNIIGKGCEVYINKFPTWEDLFRMDGKKMEKAGIPVRPRRMILHWVEKYRQGIDPYYIKPAQKLRKKAKEKRKAASAVKI